MRPRSHAVLRLLQSRVPASRTQSADSSRDPRIGSSRTPMPAGHSSIVNCQPLYCPSSRFTRRAVTNSPTMHQRISGKISFPGRAETLNFECSASPLISSRRLLALRRTLSHRARGHGAPANDGPVLCCSFQHRRFASIMQTGRPCRSPLNAARLRTFARGVRIGMDASLKVINDLTKTLQPNRRGTA